MRRTPGSRCPRRPSPRMPRPARAGRGRRAPRPRRAGARGAGAMRTSGDVTAATTPATTTGTTIVLVSAATHVAPMRTAPTPASSHDANPRSLSHCGAEKTPVSSTDSSSTTSGSSPGSEPGARVRWMRLVSRGDIRSAGSIGHRTSPSPRPNRVTAPRWTTRRRAACGRLRPRRRSRPARRAGSAPPCRTELGRHREPARPQRPADREDAPHEVVGRLLQRRAVAVRDRAEVQPHAAACSRTTRAGDRSTWRPEATPHRLCMRRFIRSG